MKIVKSADLKPTNATYLIYANPGMGKTTALSFVPGKTLVIDIDKSSIVLQGNDHIDVVEVNTREIWEEWTSIVKELLQGAADDYDTIVVDNVSELFRAALANLGRIGKNDRVPTLQDYQRVDFTILDSLRALKQTGKRLVFTAWETSDSWAEESGQTFNRAYPDVRKSILNNFEGLCDVVARLTVATTPEGELKRGFILQPTPSVYAKNRLDSRKGCKVEELIVVD